MPPHLQYFDGMLHDGRNARRAACETPALPGVRR